MSSTSTFTSSLGGPRLVATDKLYYNSFVALTPPSLSTFRLSSDYQYPPARNYGISKARFPKRPVARGSWYREQDYPNIDWTTRNNHPVNHSFEPQKTLQLLWEDSSKERTRVLFILAYASDQAFNRDTLLKLDSGRIIFTSMELRWEASEEASFRFSPMPDSNQMELSRIPSKSLGLGKCDSRMKGNSMPFPNSEFHPPSLLTTIRKG